LKKTKDVIVAVRLENRTELFGFPTEAGAREFAAECREMGAEAIIGFQQSSSKHKQKEKFMKLEESGIAENGTRNTIDYAIGTVFTREELKKALTYMAENFSQVSYVDRNGFFVGSSRPNGKGVFVVYDCNDFYMASLNFAWGDTFSGRVDSISTPAWLRNLADTEFEEEARNLSYRLALVDETNSHSSEDVFEHIAKLHMKASKYRKAA